MSASGQTLYIEPNRVVTLNNALNQAKLEEKNEMAKILHQLSKEMAPYVPEIKQNAWLVGHIDFIKAKANYMILHHATIPVLENDKNICLYHARHPLIDPKVVVSNTIKFEDALNTIVITGPNTGGKTITLKTVGLLTLMAPVTYTHLRAHETGRNIVCRLPLQKKNCHTLPPQITPCL
mgnify:CR=1 FL=1